MIRNAHNGGKSLGRKMILLLLQRLLKDFLYSVLRASLHIQGRKHGIIKYFIAISQKHQKVICYVLMGYGTSTCFTWHYQCQAMCRLSQTLYGLHTDELFHIYIKQWPKAYEHIGKILYGLQMSVNSSKTKVMPMKTQSEDKPHIVYNKDPSLKRKKYTLLCI